MVQNLPKILVVDDELRDLFAQGLEIGAKGKYIVHVADRGDEAIRKAKLNKFDLILVDLRIPVVNGFDVIRQVREFDKEVIIFAITAYPAAYARDTAIALGADEYFQKPTDIKKLVVAIQEALSERNGNSRRAKKSD